MWNVTIPHFPIKLIFFSLHKASTSDITTLVWNERHWNLLELQGLCRFEDVRVSTGSLSPSSLCILPTHTTSHIPLTPWAHIIYLPPPRCDQVAVSDSPTSSSSLLFPSTRGVCCSRHTGRSPTAPRRSWREVQIDPEDFIRLWVCVCVGGSNNPVSGGHITRYSTWENKASRMCVSLCVCNDSWCVLEVLWIDQTRSSRFWWGCSVCLMKPRGFRFRSDSKMLLHSYWEHLGLCFGSSWHPLQIWFGFSQKSFRVSLSQAGIFRSVSICSVNFLCESWVVGVWHMYIRNASTVSLSVTSERDLNKEQGVLWQVHWKMLLTATSVLMFSVVQYRRCVCCWKKKRRGIMKKRCPLLLKSLCKSVFDWLLLWLQNVILIYLPLFVLQPCKALSIPQKVRPAKNSLSSVDVQDCKTLSSSSSLLFLSSIHHCSSGAVIPQ